MISNGSGEWASSHRRTDGWRAMSVRLWRYHGKKGAGLIMNYGDILAGRIDWNLRCVFKLKKKTTEVRYDAYVWIKEPVTSSRSKTTSIHLYDFSWTLNTDKTQKIFCYTLQRQLYDVQVHSPFAVFLKDHFTIIIGATVELVNLLMTLNSWLTFVTAQLNWASTCQHEQQAEHTACQIKSSRVTPANEVKEWTASQRDTVTVSCQRCSRMGGRVLKARRGGTSPASSSQDTACSFPIIEIR